MMSDDDEDDDEEMIMMACAVVVYRPSCGGGLSPSLQHLLTPLLPPRPRPFHGLCLSYTDVVVVSAIAARASTLPSLVMRMRKEVAPLIFLLKKW